MIDIALDPMTGDLLLLERSAVLVQDVDQIAQNLSIRLKFMLGEWYLNVLAGIPYYQFFFIKNPIQSQVESFLVDEITSTRGISQITSFSSSYDGANRKFAVIFGCKTIFGEIEIDQGLL